MTGLLVRFGLCGLLVPGCLLQAQITVSASTYLGGSRTDTVTAMTVDPSGLIYVAGWTDSPDLPVVNARQTKSGGGVDAFVAKLSADGRTVLYCTYLGGSGDDRAFAIAVDSAGNAYVTGWSTSPDFPTTTALQARNSGGKDAFFSKLSSTGALSYSTYIGGSGQDTGRAIRVDASGNIYLAGETDSSNFPLKSPIQPRLGGVTDAFVLKLAPSGTSLVYSTYLGGYLSDAATALALDASGAAYVAGGSESPDFPTVNGFQNAKRGDGLDGFVTKINPAGTAWTYSSFLGGSRGLPETVSAIGVDSTGAAYLVGVTGSGDFPTASAYQGALRGGLDAFLAKVAPAGSTLVYSTYLGGSSLDYATSIAVDAAGRAWIGGYTASTDFPLLVAGQVHHGGVYDGFVVLMEADGSRCSSWLTGGGGADAIYALALRYSTVYIGGQTSSTTLAVNAPQARLGGLVDGFASVLTQTTTLSLAITGPSNTGVYSTTSSTVTVSGTAAASLGLSPVTWVNDRGGSGTASGTTTWSAAGIALQAGTNNISVTARDAAANSVTLSIRITYAQPSGNALSISPASGTGSTQVFTANFVPPGGMASLADAAVLIQAASPVSANSCQISYRPGSNAYYLLDDAATRWLGPATAGSKVTLQNSQCTLNAATSTAVKTASGVTVTYAIEFKAIFSGAKNTYLYLDGAWNRAGAWTIPMPTSGTLMSPTSGAGAIQIFSGQFIYPEGFAGVADAALLVQAGTGSPHSCMMDYRLATNGFYLLNDAGNTWLGPISAGSSLILENSQCVLNGAACKSTLTPTLLTISYAAAFKPAFAGQKDTYLYFKDLWSQVGGWTVPSATSGASLAPLAGMGSAAVFTGTVVYPGAVPAAGDVALLVQNGTSGFNACEIDYSLGARAYYLLSDDATAWLGPVAPGSGMVVENSQCILNGATSTASASGSAVTAKFGLQFKSAFRGAKSTYLYYGEMWTLSGYWNIP